MKRLLEICISILLLLLVSSCDTKWLKDIEPKSTQVSAIRSTDDLDKLVSGAYFILSSDHNALQDSPSSVYTMMSDDVSVLADNPYVSADYLSIYLRQTSVNTITLCNSVWEVGYKLANSASIPISWVEQNGIISDSKKDQLNRILGEAHFLRAFAHFELVRFFAPPYDASTISQPAIILKKQAAISGVGQSLSTLGEVYDFIVDDLIKAIELLPESYDPALNHPVYYATSGRAKKDAARFLLARVYFQMGKDTYYKGKRAWQLALEQMDMVITNSNYVLGAPKNNWLSTPTATVSNEIVWEYINSEWKNQKVVQTFMPNKSPLTGADPKSRMFPVSRAFLDDAGWRIPSSVTDNDSIYDLRYLQLYVYLPPANDKTIGTDYFKTATIPVIWANMFAGYAGNNSDSTLFYGYNVKNGVRVDNTSPQANINTPLMRIGELRLLRATILASSLGNPKTDMDAILSRAGLSVEIKSFYSIADIVREYRREMAFEGKRINYLKALRMDIPAGDPGTNPHVIHSRNSLPWNSSLLYWSVPEEEVLRNPNL